MYVPGIKYDRPVQSRRPHDVGGPGRVARAQASAAGAQARAASSVLMDQQRVAGFALQARHFTQKADREIARSQEIRKTEDQFATLDGIGELLGFAADLTSKFYEIDRQKQYDRGVLQMKSAKMDLMRRLNDSRYRMEPENPADPSSPMVPRSNHDQLYRSYAEEEAQLRERILENVNNPSAREQLLASWDEQRINEENEILNTAKAWKSEEDVLDYQKTIDEQVKFGMFAEARVTAKSALTNIDAIGPAEYYKTVTKLNKEEVLYQVESELTAISAAGPGAGQAKLDALRAKLIDTKRLVELGADGTNQYLGVLDRQESAWRTELRNKRIDAELADSENVSKAELALQKQIDVVEGTDGTAQKRLVHFVAMQKEQDKNLHGLTDPVDLRKLKGEISEFAASELLSETDRLINTESDPAAAAAWVEYIRTADPVEDLGLLDGGQRATVLAQARTIVGSNKQLFKDIAQSSFNSQVVEALHYGMASSSGGDFEATDALNNKLTISEDDALDLFFDDVQGSIKEQQDREQSGRSPVDLPVAERVIDDPMGYLAQRYVQYGDYGPKLRNTVGNLMNSERPENVMAGAAWLEAFHQTEGGAALYEKLHDSLSDSQKNKLDYIQRKMDATMAPEERGALLAEYLKRSRDLEKAPVADYVSHLGRVYSRDSKAFKAEVLWNMERSFKTTPDEEFFTDPDNQQLFNDISIELSSTAPIGRDDEVNFKRAFDTVMKGYGVSDRTNRITIEKGNLEAVTSKTIDPFVTEDWHAAVRMGGPAVVEAAYHPRTQQIKQEVPPGSGIWHVQLIDPDGNPVINPVDDSYWTYEYNKDTNPGHVKAAKQAAAEAKKSDYAYGQSALVFINTAYPDEEFTYAEAVYAAGPPGAGIRKGREPGTAAGLAVSKIAPQYSWLYPDNEVTKANEVDKATIRKIHEAIDIKFDRYLRENFYDKGSAPSATLYKMRTAAKRAAEYNILHQRTENQLRTEEQRRRAEQMGRISMWGPE